MIQHLPLLHGHSKCRVGFLNMNERKRREIYVEAPDHRNFKVFLKYAKDNGYNIEVASFAYPDALDSDYREIINNYRVQLYNFHTWTIPRYNNPQQRWKDRRRFPFTHLGGINWVSKSAWFPLRKPHSLAFTRYSEGKFKDYRKTIKKNRNSPVALWIAVFKEKEG